MNNQNNSLSNSSNFGRYEDNEFEAQRLKVFTGFYELPQSMKMLSVRLGIDRANICWFVRYFRQNSTVGIAKKSRCAITKRVVNFYTTDPQLFSDSNQLKLEL